jgi:asparagine synthase (glutamine-hydrolysing)
MCGISGFIHLDKTRKADIRRLRIMRDVLEHRGPDDSGEYVVDNIALGQRRLSILDTSPAGHQPYLSADGRYVMVYNGEIYNFKEFVTELTAKGIVLRSHSDTEVLLNLYLLYGPTALHRLNGMFAFVIYDTVEKTTFIARDRMGVKPFYYALYDRSFFFASEPKALFAAGLPLQVSEQGTLEHLFNRFVAGEATLFEGIQKLLPGHYAYLQDDGSLKTTRWWNLKEQIQNHPAIANPQEWFTETFDESVRLRMVSDVPVGVLLSGGLDSSSVLASLNHQKFNSIETFNIGFSHATHDESHLAKLLADQYNYGFNSIRVENNQLYDLLYETTWYHDEPLVHLNEPHLVAISKFAKPKVTVLLSGEGSDELMGGYVRYKALKNPSLLKLYGQLLSLSFIKLPHRFDKLKRYASLPNLEDQVAYNGANIYPKDIANWFGLSTEPTNTYRHSIYAEAKSLYPEDAQRQALYFDQHTYMCSLLDRNDRTTMGASIECREPFLDQRLIAGLGTLDAKWLFSGKKGKFILKHSMEHRLPQEILQFKKIGLSVPWGSYLAQNSLFKDEMTAMLQSDLFKMPVFDKIDGKRVVNSFLAGNSNLMTFVMPLFMFHIWKKTYQSRLTNYLENTKW